MSKIEEQVINKIRTRAEVGKKKYGTTMERTDFTDAKWLKELQAELLDGAIYAEKLLTLIDAYEEVPFKCPIPLRNWPDWANWAAMDENKSWYFYQSEPKIYHYFNSAWCNHDFKKIDKSFYIGSQLKWHETLTHRSELENQKQ